MKGSKSYYRTRFNEVSPGIFQSSVDYVSARNGGIYRVIMDTNNMTFKVRNIKRATIVRSSELLE